MWLTQDSRVRGFDATWPVSLTCGGRSRCGTARHDHPLPSGCALGLRIDERREGGDGAPRTPQPWQSPGRSGCRAAGVRAPRRGSAVREDKESRPIFFFPPATEPADGRRRRDSQAVLVFPSRTTPLSGRRAAAGGEAARETEGTMPTSHCPAAPARGSAKREDKDWPDPYLTSQHYSAEGASRGGSGGHGGCDAPRRAQPAGAAFATLRRSRHATRPERCTAHRRKEAFTLD